MNCIMTAWHQHEAELRGWLRRRMDNSVDAEDLLQDVFLKAMRQGERFCAIVDARAWLYQVARHLCLNRGRARQRAGIAVRAAGFGAGAQR